MVYSQKDKRECEWLVDGVGEEQSMAEEKASPSEQYQTN